MYDLDQMPKELLTIGNPKTLKGEKVGWQTAILHLAPYDLSGRIVCPYASAGCIAACLNTAGRGGMALDADGLNMIQAARIRKTRWFTRDREAFMAQLAVEIAAHERRAIRNGFKAAVRLNGTSDLKWEAIRCGEHANLMAMFPEVQFYDYTKVPIRKRRRALAIPNYHLTFSLSEENDENALDALSAGVNVAVAMNVRKSGDLPKRFTLNPQTIGLPVIDGDESDLRFLDATVRFVGLRAKGRGKQDTSGFIRNVTI